MFNRMKSGKKYIVYITRKEQSSYVIWKRLTVEPDTTKLKINKKNTQDISLDKPIFIRGLKLFFLVDIKDGQLGLENRENQDGYDAEVYDLIFDKEIVKQLTYDWNGSNYTQTIWLTIFVSLFAFAAGFILKGYIP